MKSAGDYRTPVSHSQVSTPVADSVLDFRPDGDIVPKRSAFLGRRVMLRGWAGAGPWAIEWPEDRFAGTRERGGTLLRQRRSTLALFILLALLGRFVMADAYDPPASYYNSATGTGATLKSQLYTITSTGFVSRSYGDARFAFETIDKDPNNSNNILLDYNRASVDGTWDLGATFNREHVWPKSLLNLTSSQVSNTYKGVASDLFELRPANPNINSSRGNTGYGTVDVTAPHSYGHVTKDAVDYWYPGDADRGDSARTIFYMATRYGQGQ